MSPVDPVSSHTTSLEASMDCPSARLPSDQLKLLPVNDVFLRRVPIWFARKHHVIILDSPDGLILVAANDDGQTRQDLLERMMRGPVTVRFAETVVIDGLINHAYQAQSSRTEEQIESLDDGLPLSDVLSARDDLLDGRRQAPMIRLVNAVVADAVKRGASDVHVQPYETSVVVRFRIDGLLLDQFTVPKTAQEELLSRIKILGRMDIAEKRLPQDGRASVRMGERVIDLRIASLPTSHGERAVIRLLDKGQATFSLQELGMSPQVHSQFSQLIAMQHGIVLVTGPTGSGKSTTLYAALRQLDSKTKNVLTLEDPIEYELNGISQTQINTKKGMTFAKGLRNILRQDPDVIMVGEIRDQETAEMAIQAALTGHLVFSTLHTNDAASAVTRLLDLNIEPFLISSSLLGVLAQRLVRRVCADCQGLDPNCTTCAGTGYRGRLGIFEFLSVTDPIRTQIHNQADASELKKLAVSCGMCDLRQDGIQKAKSNRTTLEEVYRVTSTESPESE